MKTLSKTASKTQHSEKIKPLRYRNLKRLSLNNFNRKKKKIQREIKGNTKKKTFQNQMRKWEILLNTMANHKISEAD